VLISILCSLFNLGVTVLRRAEFVSFHTLSSIPVQGVMPQYSSTSPESELLRSTANDIQTWKLPKAFLHLEML